MALEVTKKLGHNKETYSIILGVIALISSIFFFLIKLNIITTNFQISDTAFLFFFAGLALISGIIHLFSTVGVLEAAD